MKNDNAISHKNALSALMKANEYKNIVSKLPDSPFLTESEKVKTIIHGAALTCSLFAAQPLPFADLFILTPIQAFMVYYIAKSMGISLSESGAKGIISAILGVTGAGMLAQHGVIGLYKMGLPYLGAVSTMPLVYAATYAIGVVAHKILEAKREGRDLDKALIIQIRENAFNEAKALKAERTLDAIKTELAALKASVERLQIENDAKDEYIRKLSNKRLVNEEIRTCFIYALNTAEAEIDIMSPWINPSVVKGIKTEIANALKRGAKIRIVYGFESESSEQASGRMMSEEAVKLLKEWFGWHGDKLLIKMASELFNASGTHAKLLLCDEKFYLIGSMNLLSFAGDYSQGAREETAEYSCDTRLLREYRKRYFDF